MKKNILFIIPGYNHGGTNKSLQNMLSLLDSDLYNFYIFTTNKDDFYKNIFSKYKIIKTPNYLFKYCNSNNLIIRLLRFFDHKFGNIIFNSITHKVAGNIEKLYKIDTVVAFEEGKTKNIVKHFKCKRIAWIHCDYKFFYERFSPNLKTELKVYSSFDNIICVSQTTAKSFISIFPSLSSKVLYIYNLLDVETINRLSNDYIDFDCNCFKIVSVGRLDTIKRFDKIPYIVNEIFNINKNLKFKWFIIGDGDQKIKDRINLGIKKYGLDNIVICLGLKNNPYPYIRQSELLVSTSLSEAYPYVVNESKILKTPILLSNFDSAFELVRNDNAIISSIEDMPHLLVQIMSNYNGIYDKMVKAAKDEEYSNSEILNKLNNLFLN